jgi:hypothetical protein
MGGAPLSVTEIAVTVKLLERKIYPALRVEAFAKMTGLRWRGRGVINVFKNGIVADSQGGGSLQHRDHEVIAVTQWAL